MSSFLSRLIPCALTVTLVACSAPPPGVARGEELYDTCAPCHGDQGQGKQELGAPALAGAPSWYLAGQLDKFNAGARGYHYQDAGGLRMRPMRRVLATDEEVESVIAYVMTLAPANPAPTGIGDAAAGASGFPICSACHGVDGEGVEALSAPSLHHLADWYIAESVQKYRDGLRGATPGDASGVSMRSLVLALDDEGIDNVAAFVQTLGDGGVSLGDGGAVTPAPGGAATDETLAVDAALLPDGATVAMVREGQSIFHGPGICYTCHVADGVGGPLAPAFTDEIWLNVEGSYTSIIELINTGVPQPIEHPGAMLPRAGMNLSDDQVAAVAAYVYMLSR